MHHTALSDVSGVITGGAGKRVTGVLADNATAATVLWFQLHNLAADPTNEEPLVAVRVGAGALVQVSFEDMARDGLGGLDATFADGIAWGWSSTRDTYTAHGTASEVSATIFYEEP
ncbi:MAG: hypothetical protein IT374_26370 [Polyangiaceae bacterium]|nr:hypothetical protein [Polyangiaceae bacterium]